MRIPIPSLRSLTVAALFGFAGSAEAQDVKDVAAVLTKNCIGCHSGQAKMGGLDLQTAESLRKGGKHGLSVIAGQSEQSRLFLMMAGKLQPAMPIGGKVTAEAARCCRSGAEDRLESSGQAADLFARLCAGRKAARSRRI
jgi:mono/diheme cytochrome c family protein